MSIGFKEWALVCAALGRGAQHVIIRKGGIAEGRDGFRFQHREFFLFPTLFHEQLERTNLPADTKLPEASPETVRIELLARVVWTELVEDLTVAHALQPFHILKPEIVEERFRYDEPQAVNVALLRVYRLPEPWNLPMQRSYGGCRSWVTLPEREAAAGATPVLTDEVFAGVERNLRDTLAAVMAPELKK